NLADTLVDLRPKGRNEKPPSCDDGAPPADQAGAAPVPPEAPAPSPSSAPAASAAPQVAAHVAPPAARAAPPPAPVAVAAPVIKPAPQLTRVFFQIVLKGARTPDEIDPIREELAPFNYRVVGGVQRIDRAAFNPYGEVRYFGAAERDIAQNLADYLNAKFKDE